MRARKSKDPYKRLYDDMRALYVAGDQQGVVDLAIAEIDMFPAFDADELYHTPAYKASRLLLDDLQRRLRWLGAR